jgi:ABC-type antimicrobial peptide transport system permease subunit
MVKGRVLWRRVSTIFEVLGRLSGASGTIIAFAGSSDITGDTLSRAFAFSAGCLGTTSIVSTLFATFARQQSIERSTAINKILDSVDVESIPDIAKALDIQGTNHDS